MILLLGATGYIGRAFARALRQRGFCFIPLSRKAFDYTRFDFLFDYLRKIKPDFLINAVDWADLGNGGNLESDRTVMLQENTLLPQTVSRACGMTNTQWGQISSGSIYSGAKVLDGRTLRVEKDLTLPDIRKAFVSHPDHFLGFSESDQPNFSFNSAPCSFYSGTRALAEESIKNESHNFIWRLRLPFNEEDEPSNFLSQLQASDSCCGAINSLSHVDDCVNACLDLWERRAPFGIYNVTNPGAIDSAQIIQMAHRIRKLAPRFQLYNSSGNSAQGMAKCHESNCILDTSKLYRAGIKLRHVEDALANSLGKWHVSLARSATNSLPASEVL
jgi:dTDP-4-dehydrorhamnose reductase